MTNFAPIIPLVTAEEFMHLGMRILGSLASRRFTSFFGIEPRLVAVIWKLLVESGSLNKEPDPEHFLMALVHMKCFYATPIHPLLFGCEKTVFRKWAWYYIERIAALDVADQVMVPTNSVATSVVAVDFAIQEPNIFPLDTHPFAEWYSSLTKSAALR